jgi:hypothetical protein
MVYIDRAFTVPCNLSFIANEKGFFNGSSFDTHPFDKSFGLGRNRKMAGVYQTNSE